MHTVYIYYGWPPDTTHSPLPPLTWATVGWAPVRDVLYLSTAVDAEGWWDVEEGGRAWSCASVSDVPSAVDDLKKKHCFCTRLEAQKDHMHMWLCMHKPSSYCKRWILRKLKQPFSIISIHGQIVKIRMYSGTPLNDHPWTADIHYITDTYRSPDCISIAAIERKPLNSDHPAIPYNGQRFLPKWCPVNAKWPHKADS